MDGGESRRVPGRRREAPAEELRALRDEVSLWRVLGESDAAGAPVDRLLDRFLRSAMRLLRARAGTIFARDAETGELVFRVVTGRARSRLRGMRVAPGRGIAGWVARHGRPLLVRDVRADKRWWPVVADLVRYPTRDILAVPLRARSGVLVGVLELLNHRRDAGFGEAHLERLARLAGALGTLLENALLWDAMSRQSLRQRLLGELSHLVAASLEPRQVHRRTLQAAMRLVDCEAASLLLRDAASGGLFFELALGGRALPLRRARLEPGEGIAGWVAVHRRPLVVHDCRRDPRWSARVDRQSSFRTRDMCCVPVLSRGEALGVLQAINKRAGRFDAEDLALMQTLADRVAVALDNARLFEGLRRTLLETSEALAESIEVRDAYTGGHTRRVVDYSLAIGRRLGLPEAELAELKLSAILHDIGKIGVDDRVLRKPGALEGDEVRQMRRHPELGVEILRHVGDLRGALPGIRSHHERYDGRGYPDQLAGEEIPRVARIIAVADTFDAMTSDRPYRPGLPWERAMAELRRCAGSQFDPRAVRACLAAIRRGEFGPRPAPRGRRRARAR